MSEEGHIDAVYNSIVDQGGHKVRVGLIAKATGLPHATVIRDCQELAERGRIRFEPHYNYRGPSREIDEGTADLL